MKSLKSLVGIMALLVSFSLMTACGSSGGGGGSDNSQYCYNHDSGEEGPSNNLCTLECDGSGVRPYNECLYICYTNHGCDVGCTGTCIHNACYNITNTTQYTSCVTACVEQCGE